MKIKCLLTELARDRATIQAIVTGKNPESMNEIWILVDSVRNVLPCRFIGCPEITIRADDANINPLAANFAIYKGTNVILSVSYVTDKRLDSEYRPQILATLRAEEAAIKGMVELALSGLQDTN